MTHNLINKIEIIYSQERKTYNIKFNNNLLETQRKSVRDFKDLNQIGVFLQDLYLKNSIDNEMQEKDLLFHLKHNAIEAIEIIKNKDFYSINFKIKGVNVVLLTQKQKKRVFKTINALLSFLKSFFGEEIYKLEKIFIKSSSCEESFISEEKGACAYDKFILKLADPNITF